jgi:hypothetical protein
LHVWRGKIIATGFGDALATMLFHRPTMPINDSKIMAKILDIRCRKNFDEITEKRRVLLFT